MRCRHLSSDEAWTHGDCEGLPYNFHFQLHIDLNVCLENFFKGELIPRPRIGLAFAGVLGGAGFRRDSFASGSAHSLAGESTHEGSPSSYAEACLHHTTKTVKLPVDISGWSFCSFFTLAGSSCGADEGGSVG